MSEEFLLGIDIGTQGAKAIVINQNGEIRASGSHPYDFSVPKTGWAEQHPHQWWDGVKNALKQISQRGIELENIKGIGISGQMHSLVLLDENKKELGSSILWNDVRTHIECKEITDQIGETKLLNITQNAVLPGFTAPKLLWIKKHEPERYSRIKHMMQPKDYIVFKLSGELSTDVSDASGTSLFDVKNRCWSNEIIEALKIPHDWLPQVHESQTIVGQVSIQAAAETGLPFGIPITAGAGDNAAAALGNGIYKEGKGIISIGTSGTVFAPLKQVPERTGEGKMKTLHLFCHCLPGTWHAMGVTLSAGMSLKWFKETFSINSYDELLSGVEMVPSGSEGLVFLPYLNGERTPHNNSTAQGVFFGMGYQHTRAHFTRALLEGVSFSLKDCLELIEKMNIRIDDWYVTGGASKSGIWRSILADVLQKPLRAFEEREGPAFGAALLAGLGTGVWKSPDEFPSCFDQGIRSEYNARNSKIYKDTHEIYSELYNRLVPLYSKTSNREKMI
ncbi:xylulokinase [Fictibacillus sp. NPDC058756]|uniref:xylulokinase n=1 Tax=Fictibacillus sp. NPDC058756 TaxID=3346625 RepID=UPI0036CAA157